jgi:hypothetical protein
MFRLFSVISLLTSIMVLTACHSIYKAEYRYVPPQAVMDKYCAQQCSKGKRYCQQICQLKHPKCFAKAYQNTLSQYESYKQERMRKGEKVVKSLRDFDQNYICYSECNCVPSFNTCYTACGGQVIPLR